ncbi:zinc finger protein 618 isoform X6 [Ictalurus punctatus]|uniref:Zinc finger protein 618 isoform X6 n=1 Tax=Ictalurus punctatus TaxID=7998 RepID=A0A979EN08_ICTPU|nr:zinc finger protein 618 isoform X6 [Ictalurus punctatus]
MSTQEVPNASLKQGDTPSETLSAQAVLAASPKTATHQVKTEPRRTPTTTSTSNGKESDGSLPAEICVVIGSPRNSQTQGSYVCRVCGKKYKYYNCFQTHVRAHRESESTVPTEAAPHGPNNAFRYTCDICGKKYKYYSCFQEHRELHAVDDPYDHVIPVEEPKEEIEPYQKIGPNATSPMVASAFPTSQTDNENHTKEDSAKACQAPAPSQEQTWKSPQPAQRNHIPSSYQNRLLPEKERQQVAERLLRMMCTDLGLLGVLSSKDFLKLAQTLVDTGSRHGAYSIRDALGDMSTLALKQLPRMYNQVKVKVTCALGSNSSLGIAVTCHSQTIGPDSCYVLTAYQVEGVRLRRYVLGIKESSIREGPEHVHHWVQNVLSEFVMSEIRTVYVTEPRLSLLPSCGRSSLSLRCAGCSLSATIQAVLGRRSLQARGLHELGELLATCRDIAGSSSFNRDSKATDESPPPPCWDFTAEALLKVHENFEAICEVYGRCKSTAPLLQGLNKHLLSTLASLLAPLRQAAQELGGDRWPTLQQVLPSYLRLEKLFTSKAGEAGAGSKLCHYFLEALKENFKVERVHQVAMILDPQLKLRPVPGYQHEEIISRVCDMAVSMKEPASGGPSGISGDERESDGPAGPKRGRMDCGIDRPSCAAEDPQVRKELFQYLGEPLFQSTGDLFQYWSSVMDRYPKLSRLALWLLAVPAMGVRSECISICEQTFALKRKREVTAEEMNKLVFLKCNFA